MRAFAFICFAVGAPDAWALLDARRVLRGSNRLLSTANFGQLKVTASDAASGDQFGVSVAIDGDTAVVGTYGGEAAYVLRTTDGGATYDEVAKLTASDGAYGDNFGVSVAIDGDTVVVGAEQTYSEGPGAAYVYRTTDGWSTHTEIKLTASDGASEDLFGHSVAIDGETVLVGAYEADPVPRDSGSAYVFRTSDGGTTYPQVAKLTAADAAAFDEFGRSVAIDGGIIVAGAPYDSGGSVYVFSPPAPTVQPTPRPTWTFQPTPQPTVSPKPTTPQPSTAALGSDSATRAGGTLATALLAFAATALAL